MSIDGIGKPPAPPVAGVGGGAGAERAGSGQAFRVGEASAAAPTRGSPALDSLSRGEITLDQYLDQRVDDAVAHLSGAISPEQMQFVKESLREQLETDPVLLELVRRTTGASSG